MYYNISNRNKFLKYLTEQKFTSFLFDIELELQEIIRELFVSVSVLQLI